MAGVRSKPRANGKHGGWYTDAMGRTRHFVGTRSKADTLRIAQRLEDDQRQIRLGYRPAPLSAHKHRTRPFPDTAAEYVEWGRAQGGRHGRPWSATHARKAETYLAFWRDKLGLETLADLGGILPKVEVVLRETVAAGRTGRTAEGQVEPLGAFCRWAVKRGYLADDPLKGRARYDITPQTTRRALTAEEIKALLNAADGWRRLVYEVALCSGLRANELRSLRRTDLDAERGGLVLSATWTKNRKDGFQPLPAALVKKLADFAASGEAADLHRRYPPRGGTPTTDPLLYLPGNTSRMFKDDCKAAGIAQQAFGGKVDFHALRTCYVTGILEAGAGLKEAQTLARHATPGLTLNVYGRARNARLTVIAERLGEAVLGGGGAAHAEPEIAVSLSKKAAGAEGLDINAIMSSGKGSAAWSGRADLNQREANSAGVQDVHNTATPANGNAANSNTCGGTQHPAPDKSATPSEHVQDATLHSDIVHSLSGPIKSEGLALVVEAWPTLPDAIKTDILALVEGASDSAERP